MDKPTDGQEPLPTPVTNPQTQDKRRQARLCSHSSGEGHRRRADPQTSVDGRTVQRKEEVLGQSGQTSLSPFPTTTYPNAYASDVHTGGCVKSPHLDGFLTFHRDALILTLSGTVRVGAGGLGVGEGKDSVSEEWQWGGGSSGQSLLVPQL